MWQFSVSCRIPTHWKLRNTEEAQKGYGFEIKRTLGGDGAPGSGEHMLCVAPPRENKPFPCPLNHPRRQREAETRGGWNTVVVYVKGVALSDQPLPRIHLAESTRRSTETSEEKKRTLRSTCRSSIANRSRLERVAKFFVRAGKANFQRMIGISGGQSSGRCPVSPIKMIKLEHDARSFLAELSAEVPCIPEPPSCTEVEELMWRLQPARGEGGLGRCRGHFVN